MSRKLFIDSQGLSNGRCLWICDIVPISPVGRTVTVRPLPEVYRNDCIFAWASALPSDYQWAMREASECRTATDTDSYAFFILQPNANEGKTAAKELPMEVPLHCALQKIKDSLNEMKRVNEFDPVLYIGKTSDFDYSWKRHKGEGLPILLRIAEGIPEDISFLEDALIEWAMNDENWTCKNENTGSAGNKEADKLYICLSESVRNDELCEYDETILLDNSFPLHIIHE